MVTLHGEPVAEIVPISQAGKDIAGRFEQLVHRGIIVRRPARSSRAPIAKRRGALKRFLEERNE